MGCDDALVIVSVRDLNRIIGDLIDGAGLSGVERSYGRNHRGMRKIRIARARRTRVGRVIGVGQLGWNVEWETGAISKDGIETPAFGEGFRSRDPHAIERQIPSHTEADALADVAVTGGSEKSRCVGRHGGIPLLETGGIVEVMTVGVGQGVINRPEA